MADIVESLAGFAAFLRERRGTIVKQVEVLARSWDPSFGFQDPKEVTMDVVDFDALLAEIDAFGEELRAREKANG